MCPLFCSISICEFVVSGRALKHPVHLTPQTDLSRSSAILGCGPDQGPSLTEEILGQGDRYSPVQLYYSLHHNVAIPKSSNVEDHRWDLLSGVHTHPLTYYMYKT